VILARGIKVKNGDIAIQVGAGGSSDVSGENSSFGELYTAIGGGRGGYYYSSRYGASGGSAGGNARAADLTDGKAGEALAKRGVGMGYASNTLGKIDFETT
jgi:hypothetical protein